MAQNKHEGDKLGNVDWMNYVDGVFNIFFTSITARLTFRKPLTGEVCEASATKYTWLPYSELQHKNIYTYTFT